MSEVERLVVGLGVNAADFDRGLKKAGTGLDKFNADANRAGVKFNRAMNGMAAGTHAVTGGLKSAAVSAKGLLLAIAPIAAVTAVFGSIASALGALVTSGDTAENSQKRMAALIKTTGGAAGFSAAQIHEFARGLAADTLASTKDIETAAAKLITYNKVTGDAFKRTLELSQDLAEVGFGSLEENANRLGKALQDPLRGISALAEVGVSFTATQKAMIRSMVDAGETAKAQGLILDALAGQVGGAGKSQGGLAAGFDLLGQRVGEFFEKADKGLSAGKRLGDVFTYIAERVDALNESIPDTELKQAMVALGVAQGDLTAELDKYSKAREIAARGDKISLGGYMDNVAAQQKVVDGIKANIEAIKEKTKADEAAAQVLINQQAAEAQAAQAAADKLARLAEISKASDKTLGDMQKNVDLLNATTELERVRWEISNGAYKDYSDQAKQRLQDLATELDYKTRLNELDLPKPFDEKEEDSAEMKGAKERDAMMAQYDAIVDYASASEAERVAISENADKAIANFKAMSMAQQVGTVSGGMAKMTDALSKHSKTAFKINKIAGIANAIINVAQGITEALKLPWPVNLAAAASVAAAGIVQISTIQSQQYGGGGSSPSAPAGGTGGAGGSIPEAPSQRATQKEFLVTGLDAGQLFSPSSIRALLKQMGEELGDGVVIRA
jgi:hypothetical protein